MDLGTARPLLLDLWKFHNSSSTNPYCHIPVAHRDMSSGFVSGGTADAPIERSDEWLAAQQELEANRRRKAEEARLQGGKSLFETLEANKGT